MRVSPVRTIAELVREKLQEYSQEHADLGGLTVERAYKTRMDITQANAANGVLAVYGASQTGARRFRTHTEREIDIDVHLVKLVTEDPMSQRGKNELDRLVDLVEDMIVTVSEQNLVVAGQQTGVRDIRFVRFDNDPWYDEAALVNQGLFVSMPTLTYTALVDK